MPGPWGKKTGGLCPFTLPVTSCWPLTSNLQELAGQWPVWSMHIRPVESFLVLGSPCTRSISGNRLEREGVLSAAAGKRDHPIPSPPHPESVHLTAWGKKASGRIWESRAWGQGAGGREGTSLQRPENPRCLKGAFPGHLTLGKNTPCYRLFPPKFTSDISPDVRVCGGGVFGRSLGLDGVVRAGS